MEQTQQVCVCVCVCVCCACVGGARLVAMAEAAPLAFNV